MNSDINVIVSLGPSVFDSGKMMMYKYATVGVKWNQEQIQQMNDIHGINLLDEVIIKVKDEFSKEMKAVKDKDVTTGTDKFEDMENDVGLINLTDQFFEYLKNNDTKIEAIRVSLDDYRADYVEQKLKTLKTQMMVLTADDQSLDDMFSNLVKELYYEYSDNVVDIYSIILTPKQYKIINNIPIEYRGLLVRVKK